MASTDLRPVFPVLSDFSTDAGLPLHKIAEGDAIAGRYVHGAMVAKDPSDQFIYLATNADGELLISQEQGDIARLSATGEDEDGDNAAFSPVATIVVQIGKVYRKFGWIGACFREAIYQVVYIDDVGVADTETILFEFLVGAGSYTSAQELDAITIDTAGGTLVQNLVLRAKNENAASSLRGTLTCHEVQ